MKKLIIMIIFVTAVCLTMTGCGDDQSNKKFESNKNNNYEYGDLEDVPIKEPVIDWWKLYKDITKKNCVTIQVSNPNNFPIQFSYDLVFYNDNEIVKTESHWAMTGIDSNKTGIIYGDVNIPSSNEANRVEIENIEVSKFERKTLQSTFKKTFIDNDVQYFDVNFSEKPDYTEIWVALYNDKNKDKKIQADEFVQMGLLAPFVGIFDVTGQLYIPISDDTLSFTDYEIFSFAFTTKTN